MYPDKYKKVYHTVILRINTKYLCIFKVIKTGVITYQSTFTFKCPQWPG